jgi:queuine/archaeosine tRNA-ribosyltransferase
MRDIRQSILDDSFDSFRKQFLEDYRPTDENVRLEQKRRWMNKSRD